MDMFFEFIDFLSIYMNDDVLSVFVVFMFMAGFPLLLSLAIWLITFCTCDFKVILEEVFIGYYKVIAFFLYLLSVCAVFGIMLGMAEEGKNKH
jgi:hypothetical protein